MVERQARSILAQAQFRPPGRSVPQKVWHWIADKIGSLFGHGSSSGGFHLPSGLVVAILVVVVALVVGIIVRNGGFRRGRRRPKPSSPAVADSADDVGVGADLWLTRARGAEDVGDWREGVRCRYRSLVAVVVTTRLIREEIGRTAGEYRAAVASELPLAAEPFAAATTIFEETWYGTVVAGPVSRDQLIAAAGLVTEAARRQGRGRVGTIPATAGSSGSSG